MIPNSSLYVCVLSIQHKSYILKQNGREYSVMTTMD